MASADETIIGEGVALDTAAASLGSRAASALLDGVVLGALYFGVTILMVTVLPGTLDFAAISAIYLTTAIGTFVGVPVVFETLTAARASAATPSASALSATMADRSRCARRWSGRWWASSSCG